jgi:dihydropyrimidinase
MYDLALLNGWVYFDDEFHKTNIYVRNGLIEEITPMILNAEVIHDCEGDYVIPGIIDPHVHFALELPTITSRDDFYSGTRSAAFGGVTTVIDFLEPVQTKEELLQAFKKRMNDAKDAVIDYSFHACVRNPKGHVKEIVEGMKELNLPTVKLFTTYSDSDRRTYEPEIVELLQETKQHNFMVTAHIENDDLITLSDDFSYLDLPQSRPTKSETSEALKMAQIVRETQGELYMVHCSSGATLKALKEQFSDILHSNLLIESCPHYFVFDQSVLYLPNGHLYTMAPPLRPLNEVKLLQELFADVDTIGTDHCSFNRQDKQQALLKDTPLGIAGVETSFLVMYRLFGDAIINAMTKNVAIKHRLYPQKGVIQVGSDADMFVFHKEKTKIGEQHGATDHNLYYHYPSKGTIKATISRGEFVMKNGLLYDHKGQFIKRGGPL